jgi:hypothetical protein
MSVGGGVSRDSLPAVGGADDSGENRSRPDGAGVIGGKSPSSIVATFGSEGIFGRGTDFNEGSFSLEEFRPDGAFEAICLFLSLSADAFSPDATLDLTGEVVGSVLTGSTA